MLNEKVTISKKEFILILVVLTIGVIACIYFANVLSNKTEENYKKSISINERLASIKNNYNIKVIKKLDGEESKMSVSCDEDICIYTSSLFEYDEIVKYGDKYYTLSDFNDAEKSNLVLLDDNGVSNIFNSRYYDLDLIKSLIEVSSKTGSEENKVFVEISLERFLKEYNYVYSELNKTDSDVKIPITINNGTSSVRSISIEYKDVDLYFNDSDYESLIYEVQIDSVNHTDFDYIREYFDEK